MLTGLKRLSRVSARGLRFGEHWIFATKHALRGVAAARILLGLTVVTLLVANFGGRDITFGPGAIWAEPAREASQFLEVAFLAGVSSDILTLIYALVLLASAAFTAGWHTRSATAVTLLGFIALTGQNPLLLGPSDDIIRLALLWMLFLDSSAYWSLDKRRRETRPALGEIGHDGEPVSALRSALNGHPVLEPALAPGVHNMALVGLTVQIVIIYAAAGLHKVMAPLWQNGTAIYYSLQLPENRPFPWLNDMLTTNGFVIQTLTYAILITQLFFVPLLLSQTMRPVAIGSVVVMHVFVAVTMALPWSSLGMVALVAIFVSERTYEAIDDYIVIWSAPVDDWLFNRYYDLLAVGDWLRERADDVWFWLLDQYDKIRYR